MDPVDRQSLEEFVRGTLGCQCPDEVFRSISLDHQRAPGCAWPFARLAVGDRLLIYVLEAQALTTAAVSALASQGRAERDAKGYNRFRLVIASDTPARLIDAARAGFARVADEDDRAHLHLLASDQLPDVLRAT